MIKQRFIWLFTFGLVSMFSSAQTFIYGINSTTEERIDFTATFKNGASVTSKQGVISLSLMEPTPVTLYVKGYAIKQETVLPETKHYFRFIPNSVDLEEVVVTDIHKPTKTYNTVLNVSRISEEKIKALGAYDLRDALTYENNIRLSRDNAIGSAGMSLMGIGGDNVKLLIDGVPVIGRLFNQLDLEQFNLENTKQIEVVKGPMSVIYGSNALAGSINIVTKNHTKKPRFNLSSNYETDGQYNFSGTASNSFGNHFVTLSGGRMFFDGWSQNNIDRSFDWIPKEQYTGRVQYSYVKENTQVNFRSELLQSKLLDRGVPILPYEETAIDQKYINKRFDNSLSYKNSIGKGNLQMILSNNYFNRVKNKYFKDLVTLNETLIDNAAEQDTQTFTASVLRSIYSIENRGFETLIGFDGNYEQGSGNRIKAGEQEQLDAALFTSIEKAIRPNLVTRVGFRYAYNSAFESPLLYSVQTRYQMPKAQVIKLAYGKGFRAPSLKELYLDFNDSRHEVFGNDELMSETSHSFTGSYSKYFGLKNMELNTIVEGFYNNISNKIELIVTGPIQAQYGNIGVYQSVGGGVNQSIKVKDFRMNASFNYTGIFNGVDESQKEFFFSPQVVLQPSYKFKKTNTSVNLFFNYFGAVSRVFSDTASSAVNIQEQDAYSMFDITAGQLLMNKKMQLNVGVRNLLNVVNINSNTTEVGAHTPSTTFISVSPGRTFFISLRYEFSK